MNGAPPGLLVDLRSTREAVGDDRRLVVRVAYGRKQRVLTASDRDVVMTRFESPRAGKTAATSPHDLDVHPGGSQQLAIGIDPAGRLLMAVTPEERTSVATRRSDPVMLEKLREVIAGRSKTGRSHVLRHQLRQLVLEHRDAARLQTDDRCSGRELYREDLEAAQQVPTRKVKHPVVVERPAAAHAAL